MIPARGAVPQGPHPPKPPDFQPDTTPDQAHQMVVAATGIGTTPGAGQQPPNGYRSDIYSLFCKSLATTWPRSYRRTRLLPRHQSSRGSR
ncbi:hypothetical protein MRX96_035631 [Rhipicephalus microplus]